MASMISIPKFLSAWITSAYAERMTYSPRIGKVQLRSGFIVFLDACSLNRYEISDNIHTMVVSLPVYADSKESGEHDSSPTFIGLITYFDSWKT